MPLTPVYILPDPNLTALRLPTEALMQVDEFTDDLKRICGSFDVATTAEQGHKLLGAVEGRRLSRFEAAVVSVTADRISRDRAMIRKDPGEHLFLVLQCDGSTRIIQRDRTTDLNVGDLYLVDSSQPSEFIYRGQHSCQISLHIPRDEALHRLGQSCTGGVGIDRRDPLALALNGVLHRIALDNGGGVALTEALYNILGAYLCARESGTADSSGALYQKAIECIARRACDPDFDLDALVSDLGVSRRTLQRAFGRQSESVTGVLLSTRLNHAKLRLGSLPPDDRGNIAQIAYESGFNDLSHFYRVFRERFGVPPGQSRKLI